MIKTTADASIVLYPLDVWWGFQMTGSLRLAYGAIAARFESSVSPPLCWIRIATLLIGLRFSPGMHHCFAAKESVHLPRTIPA